MHHVITEYNEGAAVKINGTPIQLGDTVEAYGQVLLATGDGPDEKTYKGYVIRAWGLQRADGKWMALSEILQPA